MRRLVLAAVLAALIVVPAAQAWSWPAGGAVLQPFLFDPAHPYAAGQQRGIVIGADPGAPVLAPAAGTVTFAGTVPSSGKSITITTADGFAVTLTHLGSLAVAKDATVAEGDVVATASDAGDTDFAQPYVHLGVRVAAEPQGYRDPLAFLPARAAERPVAVEPQPAAPPDPAPVPVVAQPAPVAAAAAAEAPEPAPAEGPPAPAPAPAADPQPAAAPLTIERAPAPRHVSEPPAVPAAPPRADPDALATVARRERPHRAHAAPTVAVRHSISAATGDVRAADARFRPVPEDASHRVRIAPVPPRTGTSTWTDASLLVVVLLGGAAACAAWARRRAVPTMDAHALLRHHPDLLRQRPAAHRSLVHDHRGRHPRAPSPAARRGDLLPHGGRRARDEGLARS